MKVALLGAPGSGKTEIGKRLVRNLNGDARKSETPSWKLIDEYVQYLAQSTGRRYGIEGDIPHNLQVMAERWTLEAQHIHVGLNTITCGSIYETILYAALSRINPPENEMERMEWLSETQVVMQFFGLMQETTVNYDLLFYLPLANTDDRSWEGVVNAKIPEVLEGYFKYAVPLTGTTTQKVKHALAAIRHVRDTFEAPPPSDERQPV